MADAKEQESKQKVRYKQLLDQLVADTVAWEANRAEEVDEFVKTKWNKPGVGKFSFSIMAGSYMYWEAVPGIRAMEHARHAAFKETRKVAAQIRRRLPKHISGIHLKFVEYTHRSDQVTVVDVFLRNKIYVAIKTHTDSCANQRIWVPYPKFDLVLCGLLKDNLTTAEFNGALEELNDEGEEDMDHLWPGKLYKKTLEAYKAEVSPPLATVV